MIKFIENEIENQKQYRNGYIIIKANSIVDTEIISKLYQASTAGVKIDMLIRGICRLKPGIKGISENIRVYSLVGRLLEHSRLYYFNNNGNPKMYSGSADGWKEILIGESKFYFRLKTLIYDTTCLKFFSYI